MIFSSLACLFSLCTQVLFTWIKDGKINNNTMQTGTCKIPTEGMTVPRPAAPALPPVLSLPSHRVCLTQPSLSPVCQEGSPQPPVVFLKRDKMKSEFPWQNQQQEMGRKRCTCIASSCCPAHGVPAPLTPLDSAATTGFSALQ